MRMVDNVNSHMTIVTWINIFFADHVPDNREAEVDKRIQIMSPANQPNTVFEIENQGIFLFHSGYSTLREYNRTQKNCIWRMVPRSIRGNEW